MDALRIENEILRSQLGALEEKLDKFVAPASPAHHSAGPNEPLSPNHPDTADMGNLSDMMVQIQIAKEEALKHGNPESSREKLIEDINYLYSLLTKAKQERVQLMNQQNALKDTIKQQKAAYEKLQAKKMQDKIIFVEMLKRERVQFEQKLVESDEKVMWFENEMKRVAEWARNRQNEYNKAAVAMHQEISKSKQEAVDSAKLVNQDLASELESLRYEASEMLR
jgi:hypothetical protein